MNITNKKILIVSPVSKVGGKATFTGVLLNVLQDNRVSYYHIDLVRARSRHKVLNLIEHLISFFYFKIRFIYLLTFRRFEIVQIHASTFFDFLDLSVYFIITHFYRKKLIVRYGGGRFEEFYGQSGKFQKRYIEFVLNLCDRLIIQSDPWKDYFQGIGVKNEVLFHLPNFVDAEKYVVDKKKYELEKINILFMPGRSLKRKGYYDVREEILEIANTRSDVQFYLAGPEIDIGKGHENIQVYQELSGYTKMEVFNKCSIFLLPTYAEGFPNAMLEAMASGMAVITTNIPEIKVLVVDGEDCLLVSPGDRERLRSALEGLINDRSQIKRFGKNARNLVEQKYASCRMVEYLKALYSFADEGVREPTSGVR